MPAKGSCKYSLNTLKELAAPFDRRSDFKNAHGSAYRTAISNGFLEEVCAHMKPPCASRYTLEALKAAAAPFARRVDFLQACPKEYDAARKRLNCLDEICEHMSPAHESWTLEKLKALTAPYDTRKAFMKAHPNAHRAACYLGILDEICAHMQVVRQTWTDDEIKEIAAQYETRNEFRECHHRAYSVAVNRGILDLVCAHMAYVSGGFKRDRRGFVYYLRIDSVWAGSLYKVGITNHSLDRRFRNEKAVFEVLKVWEFENGADAAAMETSILRQHKGYLYAGDPILTSHGNSELFTKDVLGLDRKAA